MSSRLYKEVRERPSGDVLRTVYPIPWKAKDPPKAKDPRDRDRVVGVSELPEAIDVPELAKTITPAQFALEMIEGVQKVVFHKPTLPHSNVPKTVEE